MAVVSLQILEPAHASDRVGSGAIRLRGTVASTGHPQLFFKWYSSLVPPPGGSKDASIRVPAGGDPVDFTPAAGLPVGSQVITFSAKDVAGETAAELAASQNAGMAGGPIAAANPAPCVIHVYLASIVLPAAGTILSKASATLRASAPRRWSEAEYQQINTLRFRWRFTPSGAPAGRPSADLVPVLSQLAFDANAQTVTCVGPLPAALGTGNYSLTLRVEKISNPALGHEVSRPVQLTA
jgi:hypothetical protein